MCKEVDGVTPAKDSGSSSGSSKAKSNSYSIPNPENPPKPEPASIRLPDHTTGLGGDPYRVTLQNELNDLELSEMSGK